MIIRLLTNAWSRPYQPFHHKRNGDWRKNPYPIEERWEGRAGSITIVSVLVPVFVLQMKVLVCVFLLIFIWIRFCFLGIGVRKISWKNWLQYYKWWPWAGFHVWRTEYYLENKLHLFPNCTSCTCLHFLSPLFALGFIATCESFERLVWTKALRPMSY